MRSSFEHGNTWTHLVGTIFALASMWIIWPAFHVSWQMAMGVIFFCVGMFLMFLASTIYHWVHPGLAKAVLRKCDHISIYVMIACSYTPILVSIIGGWVGWLMFGVQWACVLGGTFYKIFAMGKYPRLSLAIYLTMGWSILLVFPQVLQHLSTATLVCLLLEGLFYTAGTWFFAHDSRPGFHAVWHVFVLLGAIAHWTAILLVIFDRL